LLETSGAVSGLLVAQRDGGLAILAEIGAVRASPDLLAAMESYLFDEAATECLTEGVRDMTVLASKWTDESGRTYEPLLIVRERYGESVAAGLAAPR
ncbi:MAG TPA: hypothetical protein VIX73_12005, partial [Kofleriaceae bacterium]